MLFLCQYHHPQNLFRFKKNQQLLVSQLQEFIVQQQEQHIKVLEAVESLQQRLARLEQSNIKWFDSMKLKAKYKFMVGKRSFQNGENKTSWKTTAPFHGSTKCWKIEHVSWKH
jgi:hypothetical protein